MKNIIRKTIFPKVLFDDLDRVDGHIALIFSISLLLILSLTLYLIKNSQLYNLIINKEKNIYHLLFAFIIDAPGVIGIFIILKIRRQKINSIGLKKKGLVSSIIIGAVLFLLFFNSYLSSNTVNINLIYNILFYVVFIGFYEELVFRGFIWPRLVKAYGKFYGTFLSGIFFGAMHLPIDIVWNNVSIFDAVILGKAGNVNILGGVFVSLVFIYIYTRNDNILLPSFIHGLLDLTRIL